MAHGFWGRRVRGWQRHLLLALPSLLLLIAVVAAGWAPQRAESMAWVIPDEHLWIGWSADFSTSRGLAAHGDDSHLVYPGVTLLWLAAAAMRTIGPNAAREIREQIDSRRVIRRIR